MKRDVDYQWRLAEVMARNGMHNTTVLHRLLRERGIDLSPHRSIDWLPNGPNGFRCDFWQRCGTSSTAARRSS